MIIIDSGWGYLGNQMSIAAFAKVMEARGKEVKIDVSTLSSITKSSYGGDAYDFQPYDIERVFGKQFEYAKEEEIKEYLSKNYDIFYIKWVKWNRKHLHNNKIRYFSDAIAFHYTQRKKRKAIESQGGIKEDSYDFGYKPEFFQVDNIYLSGIWLSEKYYEGYEEEIHNMFLFKNKLIGKNKELEQELTTVNSCAVHIRFMGTGEEEGKNALWRKILRRPSASLSCVCTKEYYKNAMNYMKEKMPDVKFYVFSNNLEYAKNIVGKDNVKIIDWNRGEDSYIDMQLMSLCKHNIISNSTFSWWGAWLNKNKDKIVICPKRYFTSDRVKDNDVYPESWIRI